MSDREATEAEFRDALSKISDTDVGPDRASDIPWDLYHEWSKDRPPLDPNGSKLVSLVVDRLLGSRWLAERDEHIRATSPDVEALVKRILAEAMVSQVPGQMERLEQIAMDLRARSLTAPHGAK